MLDEQGTELEEGWTLADVYENPEWKDRAEISYEYDHGDGWQHQLALLGRATPGTNAQFGAPKDVKILCLGGEHGAAEDAGGFGGWEDLKDAFRQPRRKESKELVTWFKEGCLNGDKTGLETYHLDILDVNDGLQELTKGGGNCGSGGGGELGGNTSEEDQ